MVSNILTYQNWLLGILLVINIFSFVYVGIDKRKSLVAGKERFSEVSFFFLAVLFSSLGIFLGMFAFHHKTRKFVFVSGIGLLVIEQILLLKFLLNV